jgi:acetyltransferase-like isoleucine patch superfamily enzyme
MSLSKAADVVRNAQAVLGARWFLRSATELGNRVRVWGYPQITNDGTLLIGDRVRLVSTITKLEIVVGENARLEIGESTFINYGCSIAATELVRIGRNCNIGTYVIMMDNDFHRLEPERRAECPPSAPITLADNVWIGARSIVLRGVSIGEGSVIGAGSVVTHDVPARSLAAGVPAKVLRGL